MRLVAHGTSGFRSSLARACALPRKGAIALAVVLLCGMAAGPAAAQSGSPTPESSVPAAIPSAWSAPEPWRTDRFFLETSVYTVHFNSDPAHDNSQRLILGEWNITEQWLVGASFFDNSFGQRSEYVYGGFRFRPFDSLQQLYFKITAGLVHGYDGQYQDKIPFSNYGIAPAIVPSVGYCINRYCSELVIFGTAGALLTFGVTIP